MEQAKAQIEQLKQQVEDAKNALPEMNEKVKEAEQEKMELNARLNVAKDKQKMAQETLDQLRIFLKRRKKIIVEFFFFFNPLVSGTRRSLRNWSPSCELRRRIL